MDRSDDLASPRLSVRIDLGPERRLGPGKIRLLEAIESKGSIAAAGRSMEMSYRRAWQLVDDINHIFGEAVVTRQTGGRHGGGAALTPFGQALIRRYRRIEEAAAGAARRELKFLRAELRPDAKRATR